MLSVMVCGNFNDRAFLIYVRYGSPLSTPHIQGGEPCGHGGDPNLWHAFPTETESLGIIECPYEPQYDKAVPRDTVLLFL